MLGGKVFAVIQDEHAASVELDIVALLDGLEEIEGSTHSRLSKGEEGSCARNVENFCQHPLFVALLFGLSCVVYPFCHKPETSAPFAALIARVPVSSAASRPEDCVSETPGLDPGFCGYGRARALVS